MYCYVGLLSTDSYLDGVLVLNENLKRINSKYKFVCIINENINDDSIRMLDYFGIEHILCNSIQNGEKSRWKYTFDKINVFSLIKYEKIIYLDSDFLILENLDHLFSIDEFTMNSDYPYFEDRYNSSLMILKPSTFHYLELKNCISKFDFENNCCGDQNIINDYFDNINSLDKSYNVMRIICEEESSVFDANLNRNVDKLNVNNVVGEIDHPKIIHYIMQTKPFMARKEYNDEYYDLYMSYLHYVRYLKNMFIRNN